MSWLVADIGATHARFALIAENTADALRTGALQRPLVLPTSAYRSAVALATEARSRLAAEERLDGVCLAVAGPVRDAEAEITNGGLRFAVRELAVALGCPVRLVNDFYALASAVPSLEHLERLGGAPTAAGQGGVKAVVGPGSGLGMSILVPEADGGFRILPSEGGHADLAPANHLERELLGVLMAEHPAVCWETVLSGPGLVNLYRAVATLWGSEVKDLRQEDISRSGVTAADPVCHQTLEVFFGLLGSAAGNLALTVCAEGGVYIGGGIVPALRDFAMSSALRRRFDERAGLEGFTADIPLYLILDPFPGLVGAALCATAG